MIKTIKYYFYNYQVLLNQVKLNLKQIELRD